MRLTGSLQLHEGQFAPIVHLDRFLGLQAGTGDEFEAVGQVDETDVPVGRVDAFFHENLLVCRQPRPEAEARAHFPID